MKSVIRLLLSVALIFVLFSCGQKVKEPQEIPVQSLSVEPASKEMLVGETFSFRVKISPENATDKTISWSSSNTAVASISSGGDVTAKAAGSSTITAKVGGKTASASVTVIAATVAVSSIALKPSSLDLFEGDEAVLTATVSPSDATDKTITWLSSDASVASVDNGKVKGLKPGSATVSATAGEKRAQCKVTVKARTVPVESITLDRESLELTEGQTYTLTATVLPGDATDKTLSWESSDPSVATVNGGTVKAVSKGETSITATSSNGKSAQCRIVVLEAFKALDLGLSVKWANMNLGAAESDEGGAFYAWGETSPKTAYTWETYKYANGTMDTISKYGDITDSYVLSAADDAASSAKGASWRMPTKHDFDELITSCDITWSDTPKGYTFQSKVNGQSVFFPAGGYMEGDELQTGPFCLARYWTASTGTYDEEAAYLGLFNNSYGMSPSLNSAERCMGYLIRPVQGDGANVPEAKIKVEGREFDFGVVKPGEKVSIPVTVSNVGEAELNYYVDLPPIIYATDNFSGNITIFGNTYGAATIHTLAPGESDTFTIQYKPVEAGVEEYSKFVIYSDAINGNKRITVRGKSAASGSSNEDIGYGDWDF